LLYTGCIKASGKAWIGYFRLNVGDAEGKKIVGVRCASQQLNPLGQSYALCVEAHKSQPKHVKIAGKYHLHIIHQDRGLHLKVLYEKHFIT
jgi:hypothetical protein